MRKSRKWLSVMLAVVLLFTTIGMTTMAAEETAPENAVTETNVTGESAAEGTDKEISGEETVPEEEIAPEDDGEIAPGGGTEEIDDETAAEETTDDAVTEEPEETDPEEEIILPEDEDNWMDSGHKAPKREMELSSAMVAEKRELQGTKDSLEKLQKNVNYVGNQAVFLASSKGYAETVADGYGAELVSFDSGVAVISFEDEVTEILAMAEDQDVKLPAVYPNYIYTAFDEFDEIEEDMAVYEDDETAGTDESDYTAQAAAVKTDPNLGSQYYHNEINSKKAWDYNPAAGKGVKVAVIDSGIDKSHEDLKGRVASAVSTYYDSMNGVGYNGASDNNGHGSHVSGIIAASHNNGKGGSGIAYNASIVSIKALEHFESLGTASGTTVGIIRGIIKATSSGARVINMSLGGFHYDALYEAAINNAVNKGIVVVAAAGNEKTQLSKDKSSSAYCSPACFDNVITVSAKNKGAATIASFSNYGDGIVDITAPGTGIYSTVPIEYYYYCRMDGTSQATPMVAAAAAYILSVSPDLLNNKTKATVNTVKKILQDSATKTGYTNTAYFGKGLLNVEAAVKMAAPSEKNKTELQAPKIKMNSTGAELTKNQVILSTDKVSLSSALGTTANSNIKIYYTLDGKTPTESSTLYTAPFAIPASGNKTIKALAVYYGKKSKVSSIGVKVNAYVTDYTVGTKTGSLYLSSGKSVALVADGFKPVYATKKTVKWSIVSGGAYASISGSTLKAKAGIKAQASVKVQATAEDGSKVSKTMSITILPQANSLALQNPKDASITLTYPATKQMNVVVNPSGASASIGYTSSNEKVATVTSSGNIKSVGNGTATITAKTLDGSNKSVKMTVKVIRKVDSVIVKSKTGEYQLAAGKTLQMVAEVTDNATNKKVNWSVTPANAASISANGTLKAATVKSVTTVTVKATPDDGSTVSGNTKNITIYPANTTEVLLEEGKNKTQNIATKAAGSLSKTVQLHPYTKNYSSDSYGRKQGSGTSNLDKFTYTSSNTNVATVSSTGLVTAKAPGTASIKAMAKDGSGKSVQCTVKVVTPVTGVGVYSKTGYKVIGKGKKLALGATVNADATNKKLEWSSSNPSIATVDQNGNVTGKSYGSGSATVTITARATDGSRIAGTCSIRVIPAVKQMGVVIRGKMYSSVTVTDVFYRYKVESGIYVPYYTTEAAPNKVVSVGDDSYGVFEPVATKPNILRIEVNADGYYRMSPVNKGVGEITWKAMDGSGKKCTYKVTVK